MSVLKKNRFNQRMRRHEKNYTTKDYLTLVHCTDFLARNL